MVIAIVNSHTKDTCGLGVYSCYEHRRVSGKAFKGVLTEDFAVVGGN